MVPIRFFLPSLLLLVLSASKIAGQQKQVLNPTDFGRSITHKDIQLLDVRTMEEYQDGHLANSLLADWTNRSQFKERVAALDKNKPVYTYCLSGGRSGEAAEWLLKNGFTTVYNLKGGMIAWKKEGMPVEGKQDVRQISSEEYYTAIPEDRTVLVDVGAVWCPPCRKMAPVIDSLVESKDLNFHLVKIDGGSQLLLLKELGISSLPVFIVYKKGKEVWRRQGIVGAGDLANMLK